MKFTFDVTCCIIKSFIGPRPTEGPIKSPLSVGLSVCPSVNSSFFFRNGSIVFSDFWHDVRWLEYLKTGCSWYFTTNPIFAKIQVLELSAKILSANQIAGFFKMQYLKKEVNDEIYFWDADKHRSLVQVDTIIVGVCSQACPKYPK